MTPPRDHGTTPAGVTGFGVTSMWTPLREVAVRTPSALLSADPARWHYREPVDAGRVVQEHGRFVETLRSHGARVLSIDTAEPVATPDEAGAAERVGSPPADELADSVFTYDPSFVVGAGAVLLRPGKPLRRAEVDLHEDFYARAGVPVLGRIEEPGTVEGGDLCWLDETTLAAGLGFRTDRAGLDQLRSIVTPHGIEVVAYDLPYHHGPEACLHLLSVVNPLDADLALAYAPLVPVGLFRNLRERGYTLLEVPHHEFERTGGMNLNVLATGPRRGIAIAGCPETLELMRSAGCDVTTFPGDALCVNCEGGPTCLTRPLLRADV